MDFFLFLLVNLTLFVRPSEIIPAVEGWPIYNYLILTALVVAIPRVMEHLRPESLSREPITVCVLGLLIAVPLSHLSRFDVWSSRMYGWEFAKVVIYYMILISVVNSVDRLRTFLYAIALFAAFNSAIAVLHYFELINVPSLTVLQERGAFDEETGEREIVPRLRATGIFNDPNDLSMITVLGSVICAYGLSDSRLRIFRFAWIGPLTLFLLAMILTKSRGGLLAFAAAAVALSYLRFGIWKTVAAALVLIPIAGEAIGGRQADLDSAMSGGTGIQRVEYWYQGLMLLSRSPLFGIGVGNFNDQVGQVAHNSFVQCYAELGLFGGTLFLGAFWFAGVGLWTLGRQLVLTSQVTRSGTLGRMQPHLLAALAGFGMSLFSLSRSYVVPTYLIVGVANAFCLVAAQYGIPPVARLTPQRIVQLGVASVCFLVGIYGFIKLTLR